MDRAAYKQELTLSLASSGATPWCDLERYHNSFRPTWPGTGAPTGAFTVETRSAETDTPMVLSGAKLITTGSNPAGAAGAMRFDFDTTELQGRLVYTLASGGTGCTALITRTAKD